MTLADRPPTDAGGCRTADEGQRSRAAYYPLFDWLRGALASMVCLQHVGLIGWGFSGNFAVQVFFALSGWLIGGILLRSRLTDLPRFFFNRGTRIWLPYALAVAITYTLAALRLVDVWWWKSLFFDLTFTHNLFTYYPDYDFAVAHLPLKGIARHFWSISVEEQFYLFAPFVMMLVPFGATSLFWLVTGFVALTADISPSAICFGVAAAIFFADRGALLADARVRVAIGAAAVFTLGLIYLYPDYYFQIGPFAAIFIVLLFATPGRRHPVGAFVGAVSYPFYLNHWIGVFFAHDLERGLSIHNETLVGIVGYLIAVGVACVLYLAVDRTIMQRRTAYFTERRGKLFMGTAIVLFCTGVAGGLVIVSIWHPT